MDKEQVIDEIMHGYYKKKLIEECLYADEFDEDKIRMEMEEVRKTLEKEIEELF